MDPSIISTRRNRNLPKLRKWQRNHRRPSSRPSSRPLPLRPLHHHPLSSTLQLRKPFLLQPHPAHPSLCRRLTSPLPSSSSPDLSSPPNQDSLSLHSTPTLSTSHRPVVHSLKCHRPPKRTGSPFETSSSVLQLQAQLPTRPRRLRE